MIYQNFFYTIFSGYMTFFAFDYRTNYAVLQMKEKPFSNQSSHHEKMHPKYQLLTWKWPRSQQCSAYFTTLQTVGEVPLHVTMENIDNYCLQTKGSHCTSVNRHLGKKVSTRCVHSTYCSMPKSMSLDKAT